MKEQTVRQKRFLSTNLAGTTFDGRQETLKELSKKRAFYKLVRDKDNRIVIGEVGSINLLGLYLCFISPPSLKSICLLITNFMAIYSRILKWGELFYEKYNFIHYL